MVEYNALPPFPPEPRTLEECKLDEGFLKDLVLKTVYFSYRPTGQAIADAIRLPYRILSELIRALRDERLIEVVGAATGLEQTFRHTLTVKGREWAQQALEVSQYVGPAPVPFDDYHAAVTSQSVLQINVGRDTMLRAFNHMVLNKETVEDLGVAVNRGRSIFLWGSPGNGKTTIGEVVGQMLPGLVYIPHAVICDHHVIKIFDATVHCPVASTEPSFQAQRLDGRWVLCRRPFVAAGGELQMSNLDLTWDDKSRFYEAPLQLKANGGVLFIDDFGRQAVAPNALLNRWIVPLEKRVDYLNMRSGKKLTVPFDVLIVFSTNLDPAELCEEAFLRRIANKVYVPSPSSQQFAEIFRRVCSAKNLPFSGEGLKYLYYRYYLDPAQNKLRQPLRSCHPRDIVDQIIGVAKYLGVPATLNTGLIDLAFRNTFVQPTAEDSNDTAATSDASGAGA